MSVANRKQIEQLIYDTFEAMDPSGNNTAKYQTLFGNMDEKEFEKFMKEFLANDKEQFVLDIVEYEHSLDMKQCENAAKVLDIPLMEYIYMPHLTMDKKNVICSREKCVVGYLNLKRTQQLLHKKNGLSVSNEKVSALTGQVVGDDKNARDSDIEATLLVALGADKILQEFHGPRSDNLSAKREMIQSIAEKGYVELDELSNSTLNKTSLNTLNSFLLSMNLKSDLITESYILPKLSEEMFT